ncbi:nuclear transport factor 2 family protein [Tropicibacter sp. Alg240-R139]|uniref:nuclear transport factor 2 family protein n=1 Tax=Tropicibacter sp. Alg240-R139 TaxID=2305991 RepID=UPI0013E00623|nr:nuclear transport factor 2 family protein [Tropicibacter sp. Alg240-R139]
MTDSKKIANAKGLYLDGIRDGNLRDALDRYTGARYTQHSTGVGNGKDGFLSFFEPFLERNPVRDIRVIRAIEDGSHVFLHVHQRLNNGEVEWVTADLFDTDEDDRMIEHWDVITQFEGKNPAGRTMVDGPVKVEDLDRTEDNKDIVGRFYEDILLNGRFEKITDYISTEQYDQHAALAKDGIEGLYEHVQRLQATYGAAQYHKLHKLIGQGNFVVAYGHLQRGDGHYAAFDIFRLKDGKLVEHWDVLEKILPPEQWNNSGKF